jgi:putative hemolysin
VLWEAEKSEIVGAYRLVEADVARLAAGRGGLYTSTLFQFREPAPALLGRAVELGRSFVRAEYQRQHLPLMLLWRAIGLHLMSQPRRHWLFGAASISARLRPAAAAVIIEWLRLHRRHAVLASLVSGQTPVPTVGYSRELQAELRRLPDVEALDRLVTDLDPASGGLPPLLRQYLRLGARFVAATRDPAFADALDVLVLVDLDTVSEKVLGRLVGADTVAAFRKRRQDETSITRRLLPATKLSHSERIT